MKTLVAGGTGAIGRPLIAELLAKGHALIVLNPDKIEQAGRSSGWISWAGHFPGFNRVNSLLIADG